MTLSDRLYLPVVNLTLCGQPAGVGQPVLVDLDCLDTQQSISANILIRQNDDGTFDQLPVAPGYCCGGRR